MSGPSVFVSNEGQWADETIRFALDGFGANVGLTDFGPRFQVFRDTESIPANDLSDRVPAPTEMFEFRAVLDGAEPVVPEGRDRVRQTFNYLIGHPGEHRGHVPAFASVWYEGVYPGVDLELTGGRTGLKYTFHVAPGASWESIRIRYEGISGLSIQENGALDVHVAAGWAPLVDAAPYLFQDVDGEHVAIPGEYRLMDDHTVGFDVLGPYDTSLPLAIDPEVSWGSYLGSDSFDFAFDVAVDDEGNVYITGETRSAGWVSDGWHSTLVGYNDGFAAKLSASGGHLWSTYVGGDDYDFGSGIAVDGNGNVYVAGETKSSGWISGGWDTELGGGGDGFLVKLDASGDHVWSTYLGGLGDDTGTGVALDALGNPYVSGSTWSPGWVSGGWDLDNDGDGDGYVVKLNAAGAHVRSTYAGGTETDSAEDVALDSDGNVYVTGNTNSPSWVSGGWNTTANGSCDGYVVKLSPLLGHTWSTYVGGTSTDFAYSLVTDEEGSVYVTGDTRSSGWATGGWDTTLGGSSDGYVVKLDDAGAHVWSTHLGGDQSDEGYGVAVDAAGNVYAVGFTETSEWMSGGWDTVVNGDDDGYIVRLNTRGGHAWSTCLGGSGREQNWAIAVDNAGALHVAGMTTSVGWLTGGWDTVYAGSWDAFVVKILPDPLVLTGPNGGEDWPCGTTQTVTWTCHDAVAAGPEVRLALHKGATFIDWIVRRTDNDGVYNWIVWTGLEPGDDYFVRVQSYMDANIRDYSDTPFTISAIGVTTPNGGETWTMGSVYSIQWAGNDALVGSDVRIGLHKGTTFVEWINLMTPNDGDYSWLLPSTYEAGYGYRIRVQSYTDATVKDLSDAPFTLELPPLLLTSPVRSDVLVMGQTYAVTWDCKDVPAAGLDVRIALHKGGAFVDWMVRKTENDDAWNWTVPMGLSPAPSYRLRLQSYTDSTLRAMSPAFTVVAP